jgi:hypothetical protein
VLHSQQQKSCSIKYYRLKQIVSKEKFKLSYKTELFGLIFHHIYKESIMKKIFLFLFISILVLTFTQAFAATRTWGGSTGTALNWTTASNWSGSVAPVAGDDIVFNTAGTLTFTTMPANVSYNSLTISQGTVTLGHSSGTTTRLVHPSLWEPM